MKNVGNFISISDDSGTDFECHGAKTHFLKMTNKHLKRYFRDIGKKIYLIFINTRFVSIITWSGYIFSHHFFDAFHFYFKGGKVNHQICSHYILVFTCHEKRKKNIYICDISVITFNNFLLKTIPKNLKKQENYFQKKKKIFVGFHKSIPHQKHSPDYTS